MFKVLTKFKLCIPQCKSFWTKTCKRNWWQQLLPTTEKYFFFGWRIRFIQGPSKNYTKLRGLSLCLWGTKFWRGPLIGALFIPKFADVCPHTLWYNLAQILPQITRIGKSRSCFCDCHFRKYGIISYGNDGIYLQDSAGGEFHAGNLPLTQWRGWPASFVVFADLADPSKVPSQNEVQADLLHYKNNLYHCEEKSGSEWGIDKLSNCSPELS